MTFPIWICNFSGSCWTEDLLCQHAVEHVCLEDVHRQGSACQCDSRGSQSAFSGPRRQTQGILYHPFLPYPGLDLFPGPDPQASTCFLDPKREVSRRRLTYALQVGWTFPNTLNHHAEAERFILYIHSPTCTFSGTTVKSLVGRCVGPEMIKSFSSLDFKFLIYPAKTHLNPRTWWNLICVLNAGCH